jgi:hypothetical protein
LAQAPGTARDDEFDTIRRCGDQDEHCSGPGYYPVGGVIDAEATSIMAMYHWQCSLDDPKIVIGDSTQDQFPIVTRLRESFREYHRIPAESHGRYNV